MSQFARPLHNKELARQFLTHVLGVDLPRSNIVSKIVDGELALANIDIEHNQTLNSPNYREDYVKNDDKRWELRKKIIEDLINLPRLENDDKIKLGKGGALPLTELRSEKQAIIIIGLPASGKSSIASKIADNYGAIILDSDFVKRKLPEYKQHIYGASIVHEESAEITFGFSQNKEKLKSLSDMCLENGHNIIIPKIGQSAANILKLSRSLKENNGYEVHLISVELIKRKATIRALERFKSTKRYVPLSMIFDEYGNDSHLCYYYLRSKYREEFKSLGAISNDVDRGSSPICTDIIGDFCPLRNGFEYKLDTVLI